MVGAAVALVTLLLYLPALRCGLLIWDDPLYVINNPHIRSLGPKFLRWALTDLSAHYWHPLTWLSLAIDYAVWGLKPLGYHLTAIVIHAANAALVVALTLRLLEAHHVLRQAAITGPRDRRQALLVAGVAGLFFGIHPLHVESVVWVSQRKDLLCAFFYLLSLLAYLRFAAGRALPVSLREFALTCSDRRYLLTFLLFVCALASKTMALTLPAVLLLFDCYPLGRVRGVRAFAVALAEKVPFFVASLFNALVTFAGEKGLLGQLAGVSASPEPLGSLARLSLKSLTAEENTSIPFGASLLTAIKGHGTYLWKLLVPEHLIPFYPYPDHISLLSAAYLPATLFFIAVALVCVAVRRQRPLFLAVWCYYGITLLPVSGIIPLGPFSMADRYTYLPGLGPGLLVGLAVARLWETFGSGGKQRRRAGRLILFAAVGYALLLAVVTVRQIAVWNSSVSLWSTVIDRGPYRVPVAFNNRCMAYREMGEYARAMADCSEALVLKPDYPLAYYNRGKIFLQTGRPDLALADLQQAVRFDEHYADAYALRGEVYRELGDLDRAIGDYTTALSLDADLFEVYLYRGIAYKEKGDYLRAIEDYDRTLALVPDSAAAYNSRGAANRRLERYDRALADYGRALALDPRFALAYCNRGIVYRQLGRYDEAGADFRRAISLEPDLLQAYLELAACYRATGKSDLARETLQAACVRRSAEACRTLER